MSLKDWITPTRTTLLLIDMQVDFADPQGGLGQGQGRHGHDRAAGGGGTGRHAWPMRRAPPAWLASLSASSPGQKTKRNFLQEWKRRRGSDDPPLCREGTPGAAFVGPQPLGGELVFSKKRYNAFIGTGLDAALRGEGIDTLVVAGLTTECCIDSSVRDAFERDYHVFIASDATGLL